MINYLSNLAENWTVDISDGEGGEAGDIVRTQRTWKFAEKESSGNDAFWRHFSCDRFQIFFYEIHYGSLIELLIMVLCGLGEFPV